MKTVRTKLAFEALEERRMLAFIAGVNYDPPPIGDEVGYVAPALPSGFAPIALPTALCRRAPRNCRRSLAASSPLA